MRHCGNWSKAPLRYGESFYARKGLSIRRYRNRLWVRADGLYLLANAYEQNPGCYPGKEIVSNPTPL